MIRINLLPARKIKRREASQRQLVYMAAGVFLALGGAIYVHFDTTSVLEEQQRIGARLAADIEKLKAEMGDYDKIKAQRTELLKQRESIKALESGRTGPVYLMREISEILTPGKGPTFDRVAYEESLRRDPNVGFNASWDTRRLWIDGIEELDRKVKIRGSAKSTDDIAEFLKRLQSSVFFSNVEYGGQAQVTATSANIRHFSFSIGAGVLY